MKLSAKNAWLVLVILAGFLTATTTLAHGATKSEIQASMKKRADTLQKYKTAGTIGEVYDGTVDVVSSSADADAKTVVKEENADRKELFEIIAKEQGSGAKAASVGEAWGKKAASAAKKGEYLKDKDGNWTKKT